MKSPINYTLGFVGITVLAIASALADGTTTMQLNSSEIHQDEAAELTIQSSGTSSSRISPPVVPGLEFSAVNQSTQIEEINGSMSATTSVTYEVTPERPGLYTIPAQDSSSRSLTLRVLPGNAPANSAPQTLPAPAVSWGANPQPQASTHGSAFLRAILPKKQLYVGEKVPIEIQMGLPAESQPTLQGLPTPTGDAFILDKLSDKPEQAEQTIDGQPFLIVTWRSTLAAIKPGEFSLSMTTPVTLQVPVAAPRSDDLDDMNALLQDPFQNPVFQNFFGRSVKKELNLTSTPETISILPLPTAGQPANFSGAVGKFTMEGSLEPQSGAVGDPLTLHVSIKGSGSFDRVSTSLLNGVKGWKTYPPTWKFVPGDSVGYSGEKDYDQAVIPMVAGEQTLPAPEFTFFNPDSRQYETIRALIPSVHVLAGTGTAAQAPVVSPPAQNLNPGSAPAHSDDGLRPDEAEPLTSLRTVQPLYFQPLFLCGECLLLIAFIGSAFVIHRARKSDGEQVQRAELEIVEKMLAQMDEAAKARDAVAFFTSARAAFQHCFAWRWKMNPAAVTVAEIDAHLNGKGHDIRQVFNLADELTYSHKTSVNTDFNAWKQTVRNTIQQAETL